MHQMTLRHIPEAVEAKLRSLSSKSGESMNNTVLMLLERSLGVRRVESKKRDLSHLAGHWSKEDESQFNAATAMQEKLDKEVWRRP